VREALRRDGRRGLPTAVVVEEAPVALAAKIAARVEHPAPHGARGDALREQGVALLTTEDQPLELGLGGGVAGERAEALARGPHLVVAAHRLLGERDRDGGVPGRVAPVEDDEQPA
jgi:hypothetical protein